MAGISQMGGGFPARHLPAGLRDLRLSTDSALGQIGKKITFALEC